MTLVLNGTTGISAVDGSAATPAIQGNDTNTGVFFPAADTVAIATGGVERMRADSSGNVGIGTSSPATQLAVTGSSPTLRLTDSSASNSYGEVAMGGGNLVLRCDESNVAASSVMAFRVDGTERARIDSSGNLLVGQTASTGGTKFEVSFAPSSAIGARFNMTDATYNNAAIEFRAGSTRVGYIYANGSATSYVTSSDYRLKEAVQPMTGALARVAALKPCTYKWKVDGSDGEGFIAHELAEVVPQCVTGEKDAVDAEGNPVYQGIDTSFLVATLTAAIQEQQAMIVALKAEVDALKGAQA